FAERCILYVFFFQAEDGIRDRTVTGVQTCALPISVRVPAAERVGHAAAREALGEALRARGVEPGVAAVEIRRVGGDREQEREHRSEERRVGKEWGYQGSRAYSVMNWRLREIAATVE